MMRRQDVRTVARLRFGVGVIGAALPVLLPLGNGVWDLVTGRHAETWPGSLSGAYYTPTRNILVGSLCALGVFLIGYRKTRLQDLFSTFAGVCAVGVALFPTARAGDTVWRDLWVIRAVHFTCAVVLLLMLAGFCAAFAREVRPGPGARRLIAVFLGLGLLVVIGVVAGAVTTALHVGGRSLYFCEWLSVWSFAAAWFLAAAREGGEPGEPVGLSAAEPRPEALR